jgi:hypothetical protein
MNEAVSRMHFAARFVPGHMCVSGLASRQWAAGDPPPASEPLPPMAPPPGHPSDPHRSPHGDPGADRNRPPAGDPNPKSHQPPTGDPPAAPDSDPPPQPDSDPVAPPIGDPPVSAPTAMMGRVACAWLPLERIH